MTEPTHDPAPVDLPDVDLSAEVPCDWQYCVSDPVWRYRLRCELGHAWVHMCELHAERTRMRFAVVPRWQCMAHHNPLPIGEPIEWRPL